METQDLLNLLADGKVHSGEEIGTALSVSRAAIWKRLRKLEELGIVVESLKGQGYRIVGGLDCLDSPAISRYAQSHFSSVNVLWSTESTNKFVLDKCIRGDGHRAFCVAEVQTGGRGRRGKTWYSPFGCNLYFSIGWQFEGGAQALEGLSLAVGVCVARVLQQKKISGVGLKWPNDVVVDNQKIAGVLLEMAGDASGLCQVVVGVGLNVNMKNKQSLINIDQPWTDVNTYTSTRVNRTDLLIELVEELRLMLNNYELTGFKAYRDEWQLLDICQHKPVTLSTPAGSIQGMGCGVTDVGAIIIKLANGQCESYHGGEISLRVVAE